ncbi:MAG: hypothetical protein KDA66_14595 [Planctomycetaceae bacterium]|nr:hypothetical protein [Planctomycetaceae bacterium]
MARRRRTGSGDFNNWAGYLAIPVVLVFALVVYGFAIWQSGGKRDVFVVNGTTSPYTVVIDGTELMVPARSYAKHTLPEGDYELTIKEFPEVPPVQAAVKTNMFSRPFVSPTIVVNPDQSAIIEFEKIWYGENVNTLPEGEWEISAGKPVHVFTGVDYEFQDFPNQITMEGSKTSRKRVGLFDGEDVGQQQLLVILNQILKPSEMKTFARNWATFSRDDEFAVMLWGSMASGEEFVVWAEPYLKQEPINVDLHRTYQSLCESARPDHDLVGEYRTLLNANPDSPELTYLLGRVVEDFDESVRLFEKAVNAQPPSAHAANALAFAYLSVGEFDKAVAPANQAIQLQPDSLTFDMNYYDVMLASGHVGNALNRIRVRREEQGADYILLDQEVDLLLASENLQQVLPTIERMVQEVQVEAPNLATSLKTSWLAKLSYAQGNLDEYANNLEGESFDAAFVKKNYTEAARILRRSEKVDEMRGQSGNTRMASTHLLLYIAMTKAGDTDGAKEQLDMGIELLGSGSREERLLASAFGPSGKSDPTNILKLALRVDDKRIYLAALATRFPQDKDQYLMLAKKLNFKKSVPYHFLNEL